MQFLFNYEKIINKKDKIKVGESSEEEMEDEEMNGMEDGEGRTKKRKQKVSRNVTLKSTTQKKTNNRVGTLGGITYRQVIQEALIAAGGKATQKEIIEYISAHHPDIETKKTWKNSVSGILSSNSQFFGTEPAFLPSGKRARYATWTLLAYDELKRQGLSSLPSYPYDGDLLSPSLDKSDDENDDDSLDINNNNNNNDNDPFN